MKRIAELEEQLNQKNSYIGNFMKPEAAARTLAAQQDQEVNPRGFDKVFGEEEEDNGQKGTFYKKR